MKGKERRLAQYQLHFDTLVSFFDKIEYTYLPREDNHYADALSKLAAMVNIPETIHLMPLCIERRAELAHCYDLNTDLETSKEKPWYFNIKTFLESKTYPPEYTAR